MTACCLSAQHNSDTRRLKALHGGHKITLKDIKNRSRNKRQDNKIKVTVQFDILIKATNLLQ